jgi:cystathionine beta-lyase
MRHPEVMDTQPLDRLRQRTSIKWRAYPDDVLPLFIAELDFPLADPIARALREAIDRSDTGYAFASPHLGEAFAAFASARWGWSVDPGQVSSTTDVSVAIVESLRQVISPGDGVVINPPIYPPFFDLVPEAGGVVVEVPLRASDKAGAADAPGWSIDLPALEAAFAAGARAYLLCNPHNPLGHPHSRDDLVAVAELAARYDVAVVSDEVHAPLTHFDGHFTPYLSVPGAAERGICVTSASKGWNLAGLKCALMVTASERMRERITSLPEEVMLRTSQFGLIANIAAYEQGVSWLDDVVASVQQNRSLLTRLLGDQLPGVGYLPPHASYLAWLDLRSLGWGDDPSVTAAERAKVALSPGPAFGSVGRGFARLNFGCSPAVLTEAVTRLAAAR